MVTAIQKSEVSLTFGERSEIDALAQRIKLMVPGGQALKDNEAMALAQISQACGLNPFIGEVWYIPGKGGMVGIRGARRYANQQVKEEGGGNAFWFPDIQPCSGELAGASPSEKVASAFKCVIHDSSSTLQYQKAISELIDNLRAGGAPDPFGEAKEIMGPKPQWIGYGYSTENESSRMNKMQLARKRAEADAIKRRFYIPFGAGVSEFEERGEVEIIDNTDDISHITGEVEVRKPYPREQAIAELMGEKSVAQQPESAPTKIERPYTPEQLKARLHEIAREYQKKNKLSATQPQRGLVANVLTECFAGNPMAESIRHAVTKYLIDFESVGQNDGAPGIYVLALLDWLQPTKDSGGAYHADPIAVKEANAVADVAVAIA